MRKVAMGMLQAGTGQLATLFGGAISVKLLAVMVGPAGVGLFSILRQAQQLLTALASLGGQNAVIQGIASREGAERNRFTVSVFWIFAVLIICVCLTTLAFAEPLAALL